MKTGDMVRVTRRYSTGTRDHLGLLLEHRPIETPPSPENPLGKTGKMKLLLPSGVIWDFFTFNGDSVEVVQSAGQDPERERGGQ